MAMTDPEGKPTGPLARVGQSDSFAGFTRIGIVFLGVALTTIMAWAASDIKSMLADIRENQTAVIALAGRTQHLEDTTANMSGSIHEFREWATGAVSNVSNQINADSLRINEIDRAQGKTLSRVICLENHGRCPQ